MNDNQVRIGVIGVGHLGQHHVKHYKSIENSNLVGIFDVDSNRSKEIGEKYNIRAFNNVDCLLYTSPSPRDQRGSGMPSSA